MQISPIPTLVKGEQWDARIAKIDEEFIELIDAKTIKERADALVDLLYTVHGAAVSCGINLEPLFQEIHRSNMTKLWTREEIDGPAFERDFMKSYPSEIVPGRYIVHLDGKAVKSPSYSPANLQPLIDAQTNGNDSIGNHIGNTITNIHIADSYNSQSRLGT